ASMDQLHNKDMEFKMMQRVATLGVPMCQPIEFGTCDEGVYSLQSWIDGKDAKDVIPLLSDTEQYVYGLETGQKLTIIDFDRSDFGDPWEEFNRIVWGTQKSPLFASGMVNGYFDGEVPMK